MALQKTVNVEMALGVPGSQAAFLGEVTTVQNGISDGTASAGQFVWAGTAAVNATGTAVGNVVKGTGSSGVAPLGLAVRLITGVLPDGVDGELKYERGENVTVAIRGDFYVVATGTATVGQSVNVNPTTGAMTYGEAGGGAVATGWTVTTAASNAGDLIVISNHG